jgi:hypothetical protein
MRWRPPRERLLPSVLALAIDLTMAAAQMIVRRDRPRHTGADLARG